MKILLVISSFVIPFIFSCAQIFDNSGVLGKSDRLRTNHVAIPNDLKKPNDCLNDDPAYYGADFFNQIENAALEMTNVSVSDKEVNEFGDNAFDQIKNSGEYHFITNGSEINALKVMLSELLSVRENPSGIVYEIHLIDDKMINAFTVGGHIIISNSIIKKANSESAVAYIIGHEIGHNEKGHLEKTIKKLKVANAFVHGGGNMAIALQQLITPAFNQPNEIEADYYGVDLSFAAGYDPRKGIAFWIKLSTDENRNIVESFLRSHPYSVSRANCIKQYIGLNYNLR